MAVDAMRPLDGLLAVSMEQAVAAPYCSSRLADAGARVIKIEREGGDFARNYDNFASGESAYFVWLNRGKESLTADIKDPDDRALLYRILDRADVFIQNLAPGAAARAGFASADLRARNPRLITVDISGYGADGAYAGMKAYDLLVQAESGLCSVTGGPEGPGRVGVSVCDIACGMYSYMAVLEAAIARASTGRGCAIETSLFAGMADWMTVPLLHWEADGRGPPRVGLAHPSIHPYGAYPTRDGAPILIAIQNEREFARLCAEVLERPELPADPRLREQHRPARQPRALRCDRGRRVHGDPAGCADSAPAQGEDRLRRGQRCRRSRAPPGAQAERHRHRGRGNRPRRPRRRGSTAPRAGSARCPRRVPIPGPSAASSRHERARRGARTGARLDRAERDRRRRRSPPRPPTSWPRHSTATIRR